MDQARFFTWFWDCLDVRALASLFRALAGRNAPSKGNMRNRKHILGLGSLRGEVGRRGKVRTREGSLLSSCVFTLTVTLSL